MLHTTNKTALLLQVFLAAPHNYNRGNLSKPSSLEVFKYMISSFSVIPTISKVFIHCEVNPALYPKVQVTKLFEYIEQCFDGKTVEISGKRNFHQKEWQKASEKVFNAGCDLIYFLNNHDHIFIDSSPDLLIKGENLLRDFSKKEKYCAMYLSHWPEMLSRAFIAKHEFYDGHIGHYMPSPDSIQLINAEILKFWWWNTSYGDTRFNRTDWRRSVKCPHTKMFIPLKELFRHFDAYSHARLNLKDIPPLEMPPGFFNKGIKIRYGYGDYHNGAVNINPTKEYRCVDKNGTDYKWISKDIPLFWKDKISAMDTQAHDENAFLVARNKAIINAATAYRVRVASQIKTNHLIT